jgi:hypothetical protein
MAAGSNALVSAAWSPRGGGATPWHTGFRWGLVGDEYRDEAAGDTGRTGGRHGTRDDDFEGDGGMAASEMTGTLRHMAACLLGF